jgi:peptide/nickel transport system substrate-binding protein
MLKTLARIAALAGLVLGGTAEAQAPAAGTQPRTTLTVALAIQDLGRLDPHLAVGSSDRTVINWMFTGLVRFRPGEANPAFIEPDLAERWTSSADGKEWTFFLRRGVQCHHGYGELTAEDVVYSLRRAADRARSAFSGDFAAVSSVEAVDPYTVRVRLSQALPAFLGLVTNYQGGQIVCKRAAEEMGENFVRRPIGTGPYMFAEYQPQQFIRLVANPQYFRGAPKLREIVVRFLTSDSTRDLAFQNGEVDMIVGRQEEQWIERMRRLPGTVVAVMEPSELNTLHLNITQPPLNDIRVRQAIATAIDRRALVQFRGPTAHREARSVVPIGNLGFAEDLTLVPADPARARALLAEAGYPNGITLRSVASSYPGLLPISEAVQGQLRRAGITLELTVVEHATYHQQIRQDLSAVTLYQAARFPVADFYLTHFYYSRSIVGTPTAITNFSHCNVADAEIEAARSETNPERQRTLWREAQVKILAALCGIPMFEGLQVWAYRANLDLGYELHGNLNLSIPITELTQFRN